MTSGGTTTSTSNIPSAFEEQRPTLGAGQEWADAALAERVVPRRDYGAHKWGVGGVLVIAGSPTYPGAAALTSRAAGRAGAGIVHLATGRSVTVAVAAAIPDVAHVLLPDTDAPGAARRVVELIGEKLERSAAVVIGPGLGTDDAAEALLAALFGLGGKGERARASIGFTSSGNGSSAPDEAQPAPLFAHENVRVVIDADALNWLAKQPEWWTSVPRGRAILTPHPGELGRLLDRPVDAITADPLASVAEAAATWGQTVVLKYGYSAASDGERTIVAADAPVSLATAGSGDVLAGMIGAFAAQGLAPLDAAGLALYVGPRAARRLEGTLGTLGLLASDLPDAIAQELCAVEALAAN